jgi:hypothetical protein
VNRSARDLALVIAALASIVAGVVALLAHDRSPAPEPESGAITLRESPPDPIADLVLDPGSAPESEGIAGARLPEPTSDAARKAPVADKDILATRVEQLRRLHPLFEDACAQHEGGEFMYGQMLLQTSILARMDFEGRYSEMPPGEQPIPKDRPGELSLYSGGRRYVVDLSEHPTLAQMHADMTELTAEGGTPDERRIAIHRRGALSNEERADIGREYDLAMAKISGSR